MSKDFKHLTFPQRCQIGALLATKTSKLLIAKVVGISLATLYREIARNSNASGSYSPINAQRRSTKRKLTNRCNPLKIKDKLLQYILDKLALGWSPEQISGRLKREFNLKITAAAIYNHIRVDRQQKGLLYLYLRHKGRKRRCYNPKKASKSLIPQRVDISERPSVIAAKTRIGDWEADTIVGKSHKSGLLTLVDRKSKFLLMAKISCFEADHILATSIKLLSKHKKMLHSITYDNGLEFSHHYLLKDFFPALKTFFAQPYKSWQRGLNEHTNGLIREYFPKGTDFSLISDLFIAHIQNKINSRPRSVLNFRAPDEVFFRSFFPS